ncbi:hypothetical protein EYF80_030017 [Liparis tanakae]|uniref:Uncharacterized protein n=1 Tax=Liparis tanakae TaxID=230148 RepID=A0A4Z2H4K1_9TELE|nr:hypothetical protein EYF80_030017 [Liparis tanakae]
MPLEAELESAHTPRMLGGWRPRAPGPNREAGQGMMQQHFSSAVTLQERTALQTHRALGQMVTDRVLLSLHPSCSPTETGTAPSPTALSPPAFTAAAKMAESEADLGPLHLSEPTFRHIPGIPQTKREAEEHDHTSDTEARIHLHMTSALRLAEALRLEILWDVLALVIHHSGEEEELMLSRVPSLTVPHARWDFHSVIDCQRPLQDGSSHDCSLTTDGEAMVHSHQEVTSRVSLREVLRNVHREGGEAEVQRDASLAGLRVLVEGSRGGGAAQRSGKRCLPAVDMPEHPDVKI